MTRLSTLLAMFLTFGIVQAQTTTDFENFGLTAGEFLNNADNNLFTSGNIGLPNFYDEDYDFWSGWAISATTDTETPGYLNQYSSITGGGVEGSTTYALTYVFGQAVMELENEASGGFVEGIYVSNSTYAYLSMLEGDSFAKRFGGETGDDPDYFQLIIHGEFQGELSADSVTLYLADYRFDNNEEDYILDEWVYIDLTSLGNADRLIFTMASSDVGDNGINTPAYFCIDNVTTADMPVNTAEARLEAEVTIAPNPVAGSTFVTWPLEESGEAVIYDTAGRLIQVTRLFTGQNEVDLSVYPAGVYTLRYQTSAGWNSQRLLKI